MTLFLLKPFPGGGGPPVDPPEGTPFELVSIDVMVEARLSGYYEDMVIADQSPIVYYPLNGTTTDLSGNGHTVTIAGSPALVDSLLEAGNSADTLATSFDGVNDSVVPVAADICEFAGLVPFTVSFWMEVSSIHATRTMRIISKEDDDVNGQQGWSVSLLPQNHATHVGFIQFARVRNGSAGIAYSPIAVTTGVPHHVLCEYGVDLSVRVWLDGVIGTPVSSTQVMIEHTRPLSIGRHSFETTYFYTGILDELSIADGTPMSLERIAEHAAQGWTPIEDACSADGIRIRYGVDGLTPLDCVAGPGECSFALRNDGGNSGGVQGWYSPANSSLRAGWGTDIPFRVRITHQGSTYTKFRGRIGSITPAPWVYGERRVHVVAYDLMHRLMMAGLRAVPIQVNQDDIALILTILNAALDQNETDEAIPITVDEGLFNVPAFETYPYAFDDIARGTPALSAIHDVAVSGLALCYANGHGALMWQNRLMRSDRPVAFNATFDNAMHGLTVTHSVEKAFNHLRVTIHQRSVGSGNVVLWAWEGDPLVMFPLETKQIWATFRDPDDVRDLIGAASVVTPVSGTDYAGDALPDGSGADRTSFINVTVEAFASSALITVVNSHTTDDVYLVNNSGQNLLQIRGIPIFNNGDQSFEDATGSANRLLSLDLPYQVSVDVAQALASYLTEAYSNPLSLEAIELIGNRSDAIMFQILARDVGDRIQVSETMTGMTVVDAIIHSVELSIEQGAEPIVRCRWGLGPYLGADRIGIAPPPPATPPDEADEVVVQYTGAASGTHNLTTGGALALTTPGDYTFAFNRSGVDVRVKGVAAGGPGSVGGIAEDSYLGGGGGGGGASNTTGVVVPITSLSYNGAVGSPTGTRTTVFERTTPTVLTHLELNGGAAGSLIGGGAGGTAAVGAGGTAGSAGGAGGNHPAAPTAGTAGVTGGGGGGGHGYSVGQTGAAGGNGTSQTGGAAGGNPSPNQTHDAEFGQPGNISGASPGQGGGGGGGVLLGGIYAGGGGGGGGGAGQSVASGAGGLGGQGVLTLTLEP